MRSWHLPTLYITEPADLCRGLGWCFSVWSSEIRVRACRFRDETFIVSQMFPLWPITQSTPQTLEHNTCNEDQTEYKNLVSCRISTQTRNSATVPDLNMLCFCSKCSTCRAVRLSSLPSIAIIVEMFFFCCWCQLSSLALSAVVDSKVYWQEPAVSFQLYCLELVSSQTSYIWQFFQHLVFIPSLNYSLS